MTQQRIDPPRIDTKRFILLLALLFGAGALLLRLCKALIVWTGVGLFDALFIAGAAGMLLLLIRKTALRYLYVVNDDGCVQIAKCYGDKINTLVEVRRGEFEGVARYEPEKNYREKYRSVTYMAPKKSVSAVLIYRREGALNALLFAPDEAFLQALRALRQEREEKA